jgi:hypothetical protein
VTSNDTTYTTLTNRQVAAAGMLTPNWSTHRLQTTPVTDNSFSTPSDYPDHVLTRFVTTPHRHPTNSEHHPGGFNPTAPVDVSFGRQEENFSNIV